MDALQLRLRKLGASGPPVPRPWTAAADAHAGLPRGAITASKIATRVVGAACTVSSVRVLGCALSQLLTLHFRMQPIVSYYRDPVPFALFLSIISTSRS